MIVAGTKGQNKKAANTNPVLAVGKLLLGAQSLVATRLAPLARTVHAGNLHDARLRWQRLRKTPTRKKTSVKTKEEKRSETKKKMKAYAQSMRNRCIEGKRKGLKEKNEDSEIETR